MAKTWLADELIRKANALDAECAVLRKSAGEKATRAGQLRQLADNLEREIADDSAENLEALAGAFGAAKRAAYEGPAPVIFLPAGPVTTWAG